MCIVELSAKAIFLLHALSEIRVVESEAVFHESVFRYFRIIDKKVVNIVAITTAVEDNTGYKTCPLYL